MKQKITLIIMLSFLCGLLYAENNTEIKCIFVEGHISIGNNGEWVQLEPGKTANPENALRVNDSGIASFMINGQTFTVSSPGTYRMGDIVAEISQRQKVIPRGTFLTKLKNMLSGKESTPQSHALGVRAAEVEDSSFEWSDVDEEDFEYAMELLESDSPGEAEYIFEDLLLFGNPYQTDEYRFYLSYSLLLQDRSGEALKQLKLIEDASGFDFYEGYLILLGRLSYEGLDNTTSRNTWETYLEEFPGGSAAVEAQSYLD